MDDRQAIVALIERIVLRARIPSRARREALRRELWTHFEDAGASANAAERFGEEALIGESLRALYRRDYAVWYAVKIAAAVAASLVAALLIQVAVNLRVESQADVWRLTAGFPRAIGISIALVLGAILAAETARRPFTWWRAVAAAGAYAAVCGVVRVVTLIGARGLESATMLVAIGWLCSRLERWPSRLLVLVGAFAAALYLNHVFVTAAFGPGRALMAGAIFGTIWSSSAAIMTRVDRAFETLLDPTRDEAV
jgi:hypothetical protein